MINYKGGLIITQGTPKVLKKSMEVKECLYLLQLLKVPSFNI
jgi:hypothetical protein